MFPRAPLLISYIETCQTINTFTGLFIHKTEFWDSKEKSYTDSLLKSSNHFSLEHNTKASINFSESLEKVNFSFILKVVEKTLTTMTCGLTAAEENSSWSPYLYLFGLTLNYCKKVHDIFEETHSRN